MTDGPEKRTPLPMEPWLLDWRRRQIDEVARAYGIDPATITGFGETVNAADVAAARRAEMQPRLQAAADRVAVELTEQLGIDGVEVRYEVDDAG